MKRTLLFPLSFLIVLTLLSCTRPGPEVTISVSHEGGSYKAFNGATLDVPPNAVPEDIELTMRSIPKGELEGLGEGSFPLVVAFEALPDGQTFAEPITITLTDLELEPGVIPLIRLIDTEGESRSLVETTARYDPEEGSLSFEVEHFTTYAVEAGSQVANTECQETPCRCGSISIQQSDASNACSADDCQILESEVSVQFNDCPGKPVESSLLKEVSPNCTPKLEVKAERNAIPPEGSTAVTATTLLSCVPVPDQSTDFTVGDLGLVDPTFQMTNNEGEADTTLTAGEEEGTATVTVNATGSYYAYEIMANGESFNGPMKTYELSEKVNVTIKELRGVFEGNFSGCNDAVCIDNYQIKLEFNIAVYQDEDEWGSIAEVTQSGSLRSTSEYWVVDYQEIPNTTQIEVFGKYDNGSGDYELGIIDFACQLINYRLILVGPRYFSIENIGTAILSGINAESQDFSGELFIFNIRGSNTIQEGTAYLLLLGSSPENLGITGTYRLTIE